jgi:ADP-ribosylglycohydrolase
VRRIWSELPADEYLRRLQGAMFSRFAGCTLGSPVELHSLEAMENWAAYVGDEFPPVDYWSQVDRPSATRYAVSLREDFARNKLRFVPSDDDIGYTILGLLILEECGVDFTTADVAAKWQEYFLRECAHTAERITYDNLVRGVDPSVAGEVGNFDRQLIGADIRCDPWAYAAPGWPEKAAELAYRDAFTSHRRNGIYGSMFFAAVISAAFTVDDPVEALHIGLEEIPADCLLAREVKWALAEAPNIKDYRDGHAAVNERFAGMNRVHTINNAVLTVWGITIGGRDVTKVISQTVAMGYDNDCTAATAGSIVGAAVGVNNVPEHWYKPFNNKVKIYLKDRNDFELDDLVQRFATQAAAVFG